ncbi:MAG: N-acetyltransferase [Proteobacteria bacterium]|nr:MAG: N-acetyltransferase [Pseudomonadota bacterium]
MALQIKQHSTITELPAQQWARLLTHDNPFVSHAFLAALEHNGCVGAALGWQPCFLGAWEDGVLFGAVPMYLKENSYGEFVFDWSWADAYRHFGNSYYPKLVVASPYTPATGPRLLLAEDAPATLGRQLIDAAIAEARGRGLSSLHWLFPAQDELPLLESAGMLRRVGVQYHWLNPGYRDFQDYLDALTAAKRKMIRRERRKVAEQGVEIERRFGNELSDSEWRVVYALYAEIYQRKWGFPTLNETFFREVGETMGDQVLVVLAYHDRRCVAGAIDFVGGGVLYGRHWGCFGNYDSLHFELCYYQGIELAIERGLQRFEPGAQGEHKISRGFLPQFTWSAHWLAHPGFRRAVERYLRTEAQEMERYAAELSQHSPFRETP